MADVPPTIMPPSRLDPVANLLSLLNEDGFRADDLTASVERLGFDPTLYPHRARLVDWILQDLEELSHAWDIEVLEDDFVGPDWMNPNQWLLQVILDQLEGEASRYVKDKARFEADGAEIRILIPTPFSPRVQRDGNENLGIPSIDVQCDSIELHDALMNDFIKFFSSTVGRFECTDYSRVGLDHVMVTIVRKADKAPIGV